MNRFKLEVPKGVRYINEWNDFDKIFPRHPHILDKQITGCGFTEWCLMNGDNVVLCSPRNILIENKTEQHPGEVYRVIASQELEVELEVDKDTTRTQPGQQPERTDLTRFTERLEQMTGEAKKGMVERISAELDQYFAARGDLPKKILVTYDSFRILKEILVWKGCLGEFQVIIDEMQSIFTDARFKADTELEFVSVLQDLEKVCFLSATPMIESYLEMIPEFSQLPYYELDWESASPGRVVKPDLIVRTCRSIYEPARKIIKEYLAGNYEKRYNIDPTSGKAVLVESREAVLYVNSVTNICEIIKKNGLTPEQTNILCARTTKNEKYITKKLGKGWSIGKVPLRHEPRKTFTFCTRTVYLGADFYSPCARSFVLSDANIDCLAVDISLDLPQIMGRQRLDENPWKTAAEFYYRPLTEKNLSKLDPEMFRAKVEGKLDVARQRIENYESSPNKKDFINMITKMIEYLNYAEDYVGINYHQGTHPVPVINQLVVIAEQRAFDIQQKDYKDRFTVIDRIYDLDSEEARNTVQVERFFLEYDQLTTYKDRLRFYCEAVLPEKVRELVYKRLDDKMKSYLVLGPERLKAVGYQANYVEKELSVLAFSEDRLKDAIYAEFEEGDKIAKSEIKERLKNTYQSIGYKKTAKANDIEEWFELKRAVIPDKTGKYKEGFELLKRRD